MISSTQPLVLIFPNPFENQFTVELELEEKEKLHVQIMNGLGQLVVRSEHTLSQGLHHLKIEEPLSSGIYFIHLETDKGRVSKKVLKK